MAREDLLKMDGTVTKALSGSQFMVTLDNEKEIIAKLSGRMRRYHIRILVGDRVTVGVSPYDLTNGLIVARERLNQRRNKPS